MAEHSLNGTHVCLAAREGSVLFGTTALLESLIGIAVLNVNSVELCVQLQVAIMKKWKLQCSGDSVLQGGGSGAVKYFGIFCTFYTS